MRNSHRRRDWAASPTASRSITSRMGVPIPCNQDHVNRQEGSLDLRGHDVGGQITADDGHVATFQPGQAGGVQTGRILMMSHAPSARRLAQRPVRSNRASPEPTRTPAFFSQASRSSG